MKKKMPQYTWHFFTHKVSEKTSILYRKLIKMKRLTKPDTKKVHKKQDEIIVKNRKNDFCPMILLEKAASDAVR